MTEHSGLRRKTTDAVTLALCFVLPFITFILVGKAFGMAPFGESSVMIMDMSGQYSEFYCGLKNILTQGGPWFSWSKTLGGSYIGVFAYYISSPLSILTLFWPNSAMPVCLFWLTALKIALSGLTMGILLTYLYGKKRDAVSLIIVFLASSYGLMSYNFVYSMSLMWLDGVIWLPIVILGAEFLFKKRKMLLLTLSLTVLFLSNYYISYMCGLFTVIWIVYRFVTGEYPVEDGKIVLKNILRFIGSCAIAAGLNAWLLLPTWYNLKQGKGSNGLNFGEGTFYYKLKDLLPKLFVGQYDSITNNNATVCIYCGAGILVLTVIYFTVGSFSKKSFRKKLPTLALSALLIMCAMFDTLDLAWHIFQKPNWFPFRWSFVIPFWFIYIGLEGFKELKAAGPHRAACSILWLVPFFAYAAGQIKGDSVEKTAIYAFFYILIILTVLFLKRLNISRLWGKALIILLILSMCAIQVREMKENGLAMLEGLDGQFSYEDYDKYVSYKETMEEALEIVEEDRSDRGGTVYEAVNQTFYRSYNEAIGFGYRSISHYSSAYDKNICSFYSKFGLAQGYLWDICFGSTTLTDSIFGVKYILNNPDIIGTYPGDTMKIGSAVLYDQYTLLGTAEGAGEVYVYRNDFALSAPFVALGDIENFSFGSDAYESQNRLLQALSGDEYEYFTKVPDNCIALNKTGSTAEIYVHIEENQVLYASFSNVSNVKMSVDGSPRLTLGRGETSCIQTIGMTDESGIICIELSGVSSSFQLSDVTFRALDLTLLETSLSKLSSVTMTDFTVDGSTVSGKINSEGGWLFTSIAYDEGWSAYVDGKKVETKALQDGFLLVKVPAGQHSITLKYMPEGGTAGIVISVIVVAGLAVWMIARKKFNL